MSDDRRFSNFWLTHKEPTKAADYILELEAKLTALEAQPAVTEGFVLVPVEPTEAMVHAGLGWREYDTPDHWPVQARIAYGTYRAMLATTKEQGHE